MTDLLGLVQLSLIIFETERLLIDGPITQWFGLPVLRLPLHFCQCVAGRGPRVHRDDVTRRQLVVTIYPRLGVSDEVQDRQYHED